MAQGWIAVDFDGTLMSEGASWDDGVPVPKMLERVKEWLAQGREVRIFTARVCNNDSRHQRPVIEAWCMKHLGRILSVTNEKDWDLDQIWDDKAFGVIHNTGELK